MNLIIDIGNSRTKLAVCNQADLLDFKTVETTTLIANVTKLLKDNEKIHDCIISSTAGFNDETLDFLGRNLNVLQLNHKTNVPYNNEYQTPQTLGLDRIGLIAGAVLKFPESNVLVIDAGTCMTYDFVNEDSSYLGGAISPGLNMRLKAMHSFTAGLPPLELEDVGNFIGDSTNSCMQSGAVNGLIHEIDGFIEQYREKFSHLTVILTGGDAEFLAKRIKNSIFANSNFLLEGLNYILEFNKNK